MSRRPHIAWFGSSISSTYRSASAGYFRGLVRALYARGFRSTFYEPDALDRAKYRDIDRPRWADIVTFGPEPSSIDAAIENASRADILIKATGLGACDDQIERHITSVRRPGKVVVLWDIETEVTLAHLARHDGGQRAELLPLYDLVVVSGGGESMVREYLSRGARRCIRVFPALDADVTFEVLPDARFVADAGFMGNRLYDRDERVERFFFDPARVLPTHRFILAGSGWSDGVLPDNVVSSGHVRSTDHNAFNSSPRVVLSIGREQAVARGFALSSRIMEAAGSAACIITDAWEGISTFFEPGREILVAHDGDEVLALLRWLTSGRARAIGQAARLRARAEHTYAQRATQVEAVLDAGAARQSISYC